MTFQLVHISGSAHTHKYVNFVLKNLTAMSAFGEMEGKENDPSDD
jgi:hypothetical protein